MEKLAANLIICSVMMTAAGMLYMLILRLLRKVQSVKWRYYSWLLIFVGFLLPIKPWTARVDVSLAADNNIALVQHHETSYFAQAYSLDADIHRILQVLCVLWAAGTAICLLFAVMRQALFNRSVKRLSSPAGERVNVILEEIAKELIIWQPIRAVTLKGISSPMTVGFLKPVIILPHENFSDGTLKMILEHELVHFMRRDVFVKAFMIVVASVHWFNPFVRLFIKTAERECELYCDETVMSGKTGEEKRLYCQAILDSAAAECKRSKIGLKPAAFSEFFSGKAGMKRRMEIILSGRQMRRLGPICIAAALTLTVYAGSVFSFSQSGTEPFEYRFSTETTVTATAIMEDYSQSAAPGYNILPTYTSVQLII